MNQEDFLNILKSCKKSQSVTGNRIISKPVRVLDNRTTFEISYQLKQRGIPIEFRKEFEITIKFKKSQDFLSIFQAELFVFLFLLKSIPYDYANYHKCIAGKEFIENIDNVRIT